MLTSDDEHEDSAVALGAVGAGRSALGSYPVTTLAERIQWILDNCRDPSGEPWTAKSLSQAADLADTHVGMMKRGTVKKVTHETLAKLARAAGVSHHWLVTGEGEPHGRGDAPGADAHHHNGQSRFHARADWVVLLETARAIAPEIPEWVWPIVADSHPLSTVPITPAIVVELGKLVLRHVPPPASAAPKRGR
jgi:hypothetical protein